MRPGGLELFARCLRPGIAVETTGSPKFLGNPDCPFAMFFDPGGTAHSRPIAEQQRGPRDLDDEGSHDEPDFEAQ